MATRELKPMNPAQTDLMIARLEAANARAYERARSDETNSKSEQVASDPRPASSGEEAFRKRSSSRAKLIVLAFFVLLFATSAYVILEKSPYSDAAMLIGARWARAGDQQAATEPEFPTRVVALPQPLVSAEIEERLQKVMDEVGDLKQQIEQLKVSQDLSRRSNADVAEKIVANGDQMVRDNAKVVERLEEIRAQMARENSAVAEQMKATQDQLADLEWSRPAKLTHKRARRRPVSILPPAQKLAQNRSP